MWSVGEGGLAAPLKLRETLLAGLTCVLATSSTLPTNCSNPKLPELLELTELRALTVIRMLAGKEFDRWTPGPSERIELIEPLDEGLRVNMLKLISSSEFRVEAVCVALLAVATLIPFRAIPRPIPNISPPTICNALASM